jgi:acyl dehydratase
MTGGAVVPSNIKIGDSHTAVVVDNLSRTQIVQYAGASGDYNPLHSDEVYATQVAGYRGVFAHGMLTMGLTGKVLTDFVGADRLTKFGVRFVNQVWPGDTLRATATVTAIRQEGGRTVADLDIRTTNQDGVDVMTGGATALLDGPSGQA